MMSHPKKLQVPKLYLISNLLSYGVYFFRITQLLGSIIVVFTLWVLSTSPNLKKIFTGTLPLTYIALGLGLLLFTNGLLGWMGSYKRGGCMIKMVSDIVEQSWKELNQRSRNLIQQEFDCCGLYGMSEYAHKIETIDSSCYRQTNLSELSSEQVNKLNATGPFTDLKQNGCKDILTNWILRHKMTLAAAFGGFLLFQVITALLSVSAVIHLKDRSSSTTSLEERTYIYEKLKNSLPKPASFRTLDRLFHPLTKVVITTFPENPCPDMSNSNTCRIPHSVKDNLFCLHGYDDFIIILYSKKHLDKSNIS
ncbi:Tetraspanin-15-like protein, partial [Dinothrombium tinctorium]